jgi:hypothetical protein
MTEEDYVQQIRIGWRRQKQPETKRTSNVLKMKIKIKRSEKAKYLNVNIIRIRTLELCLDFCRASEMG